MFNSDGLSGEAELEDYEFSSCNGRYGGAFVVVDPPANLDSHSLSSELAALAGPWEYSYVHVDEAYIDDHGTEHDATAL